MAQRVDLPLIPTTKAPRRARRAVTDLLARTGQPELMPDAALLVTELVTNAITHACGPIGVSATWLDGTLRVEVHDCEPSAPVVRDPSVLDESGRGLCLVADIADRWGVRPGSDGKTMWFELTESHAANGERHHRRMPHDRG